MQLPNWECCRVLIPTSNHLMLQSETRVAACGKRTFSSETEF